MSPATMRAVVMAGHGGPEVLRVEEVRRPEPGPGQVLVRVSASGLNRADLLQRRGRYPVPAGYPEMILGLEYSGVVAGVGAGVDGWSAGDAVMGITGGGGYAEYVVAHAREVVPAPAGFDPVEVGAIPEVFFTAFDALVEQMRLCAGETLLVHAVGSGVGTAAVQLGRWVGARTVGTSRTPEKLERAKDLGLDHAVLGGDVDWREGVLGCTGGAGADVILDLVGSPYLAGNVDVLAPGGRIITVGVSGGAVGELDLRRLMGKRASITGTVLRARPLEEKASLAQRFRKVALNAFGADGLRPVIHDTFPPEAAADAHRCMEENLNFGKLLIVW